MGIKRVCGIALACVVLISATATTACAAEKTEYNWGVQTTETISIRATNSVDFTVSAGAVATANNDFSMEAGEIITINCVYSPSKASVDFGLIAPDGSFHYRTVTGGNINETVQIPVRGRYTFAVRNNSSVAVKVVGFVNY